MYYKIIFASLFIILKIEYINIYNHNIFNLFKVAFLAILVYDICRKNI